MNDSSPRPVKAFNPWELVATAFDAVESGDLSLLARCFDAGLEPDCSKPSGLSLLRLAAGSPAPNPMPCLALIQKRLEQAGLPACSPGAIQDANLSQGRRAEILEALLLANDRAKKPLSPEELCASESLKWAIDRRDIHAATAWIKRHPDLALPNGMSPLSLAAARDEPALVQALLEAGANPKLLDDNQSTCLMWAAPASPRSLAMLLPLSDPLARDGVGMSALHWASSMLTSTARGNADNVKTLLPLSDPLARDRDGRTALMLALSSPSFECADLLLASGGELALPQDAQELMEKATAAGRPDWTARLLAESEARELQACSPQPSGARDRLRM